MRSWLVIFIWLLTGSLQSDPIQRAGYPPADLDLSKGKFVIATKLLGDPRFMQTVVLLVHHDGEGALGLVINVPSGITLSSALPKVDGFKDSKEQLFFGGPVDRSRVFMLLRSHSPPKDSTRIFDHVYFSSSKEVVEEVGPVPAAGEKLRLFAGYSGWGKGQLEREIQSGHWLVWHADMEIIFDRPSKEVWQEMIERSSVVTAQK